MSNHPRRRWRGRIEHLLDVQRRPALKGRPSGTQRRRAKALRRRLDVHERLHQELTDPKCPHCPNGPQISSQRVYEPLGKTGRAG